MIEHYEILVLSKNIKTYEQSRKWAPFNDTSKTLQNIINDLDFEKNPKSISMYNSIKQMDPLFPESLIQSINWKISNLTLYDFNIDFDINKIEKWRGMILVDARLVHSCDDIIDPVSCNSENLHFDCLQIYSGFMAFKISCLVGDSSSVQSLKNRWVMFNLLKMDDVLITDETILKNLIIDKSWHLIFVKSIAQSNPKYFQQIIQK